MSQLSSSSVVSSFVIGFSAGCACVALLPLMSPDMGYILRMWVIDVEQAMLAMRVRIQQTCVPQTKSVLNSTGTYEEQLVVRAADIDRNLHMNNARYVFLLNFTRRKLFNTLGLWSLCRSWGSNMIVKAQSIRYRKELKLGEAFTIRCRILGWHEAQHCFYVETLFLNDVGFVLAVHHLKYVLVGDKGLGDKGLRYCSPTFALQTAQLIPPDFRAPSEDDTYCSYSGAIVTNHCADSGIIYADGENEFVEQWEKANAACSKALNPRCPMDPMDSMDPKGEK
ncbi:HotDog domain-containing protein [Ochromonadaceae sp. CCMP2298]|nr:HotDog domain-containing protein [Ochromonadaceae sp. CCMP2298]|mmetsp:Transcript_14885/g.32859  ORF Transcript_14885/g.32859 Transcript_14885/m.32859 type:complete len:281 (-) Transcript_14885:73-915(-)